MVAEGQAQTSVYSSTAIVRDGLGFRGVARGGVLAPQVRITSPTNGSTIGQGLSQVGSGSPLGSAFAIDLEIFTRDDVGVLVDESINIRNVDALSTLGGSGINPQFPGLFVFFDRDIITPDGEVIAANTNLGMLFNIAGTDDTPGPGVTIWTGWHVLESFFAGDDEVTITAAVVDEAGRIGFDAVTLDIEPGLSGNDLTPDPSSYPLDTADNGPILDAGPLVEIVGPRVPSALAAGDQNQSGANSGSLHFIQINVVDVDDAGIAVDELGTTGSSGVLADIADPPPGSLNSNFPGLFFAFDVPFLAPNGAQFPAGTNLAPVFNIAGSEIDEITGHTRVVANWVVGGSLLPGSREFVTLIAKVTDNNGNTSVDERTFRLSPAVSGEDLTPNP